MKNLQKLGKALTKAEQRSVIGGLRMCGPHCPCPSGQTCWNGTCTSLLI